MDVDMFQQTSISSAVNNQFWYAWANVEILLMSDQNLLLLVLSIKICCLVSHQNLLHNHNRSNETK